MWQNALDNIYAHSHLQAAAHRHKCSHNNAILKCRNLNHTPPSTISSTLCTCQNRKYGGNYIIFYSLCRTLVKRVQKNSSAAFHTIWWQKRISCYEISEKPSITTEKKNKPQRSKCAMQQKTAISQRSWTYCFVVEIMECSMIPFKYICFVFIIFFSFFVLSAFH